MNAFSLSPDGKLAIAASETTLDTEFWMAFKAHSDIIVSDASPDDAEYVGQQIDLMLAEYGMPRLSESPT